MNYAEKLIGTFVVNVEAEGDAICLILSNKLRVYLDKDKERYLLEEVR